MKFHLASLQKRDFRLSDNEDQGGSAPLRTGEGYGGEVTPDFRRDTSPRRMFLLLFLVPIILIQAPGCGKKEVKLPTIEDTVSIPYQDMEKSTMYFYDRSIKRWKLEAVHMRKNLDAVGKVIVSPVLLTLYDSLGTTGTRVWADSGSAQGTMDNFLVWGSVLVKTADKMVIRTQKLWWNKNTHKVYSDTYVQITAPNSDVFRGKGLDAWEDFSTWSFKSNVTGEFPNFKDRLEKGDQLF